MHLLIAREAVDKHLQVAGVMVDPKSTIGAKIAGLPKIAAFYAWWYPTRWLKGWFTPLYLKYGKFAKHLRFIRRSAAKLARASFHGMLIYREKLERKQVFLFRLVDIVNELFAMSASISRSIAMQKRNAPEAEQAALLADMFCQNSRRLIKQKFDALWNNDDEQKVALTKTILNGEQRWMERMPDLLKHADESKDDSVNDQADKGQDQEKVDSDKKKKKTPNVAAARMQEAGSH